MSQNVFLQDEDKESKRIFLSTNMRKLFFLSFRSSQNDFPLKNLRL